MPKLTDPETLHHYCSALSSYKYEGYVIFAKEARDWLRIEMPGWTQRGFAQILHDFVRGGGEIDQVEETREHWSGEYAYHYDLRPLVKGRRRCLYVETRLVPDFPKKRDNPYILIANIHDA